MKFGCEVWRAVRWETKGVSTTTAMGDRRICLNRGRLEELEEDFCSNEAKLRTFPKKRAINDVCSGFWCYKKHLNNHKWGMMGMIVGSYFDITNNYIGWTIIRINHKYLRCHWNDGVNKGVSYPKWQDFSGLWFIIFYSTRRQIKNISLRHFKWISSLLVPGEDIEIHMVHFPAEESLRTTAQIRNLGVGACFTSALIGCWWSSVFSALQRRILLYYFFWQFNLKCSIPSGNLT